MFKRQGAGRKPAANVIDDAYPDNNREQDQNEDKRKACQAEYDWAAG
jgi:hypothetical protein